MAKSFLVSPGRAYLVIAEEGTKIVRTNGTLIDTVPEGANAVSITVDTHEIIVMDNAAKIQQLYNGNSGSSGIMTTAEGEDAGTWKIEIVSSLPAQGSAGVIYMLRTNRTGTDRYDDYIWIPGDNAYELLGRRPESTPVDLSNVAKTDVANTFTKSQQINGTLTATDISVMRSLSCEQRADIGTAVVNDLDYNTASGGSMTVSRVTILTSLHVAPQAAVDLPGVAWRASMSDDYIDVTRKLIIDTAEIRDTLKVSNVLTLGTGSIELDGRSSILKVANDDAGVFVEPSHVRVLHPDATLTLQGDRINMQTVSGGRTVFSLAQNGDGKFLLNVSDGATLSGAVSMPGTLTVNNLNVTGTVTGITTGGGTTPTVDFSNGVTIMQVLTADDIVADTVAASTLSAGSSLSVSSESVIYRHTDGALYVHGDIVNATKVAATTFLPTNIQGATFTGPLVMTKDNALRVWRSGGMSEISNGNIIGFYYAQFEHCTVTQHLTMEEGQARNASVTDTLVVKDLVVTGTTAGLRGIEGDITVEGDVSAVSVLANYVQLNVTGGASNVSNARVLVQSSPNGSPVVKLQNSVDDSDKVYLEAPHITAMDVLTNNINAKSVHADSLHADTILANSVGQLHTSLVEVLGTNSKIRIESTHIALSRGRYDPVARISTDPAHGDPSVSFCNVLMHSAFNPEGSSSLISPITVLHVPSLQIGPLDVAGDEPKPYAVMPYSCMIALYNAELSSMCCLRNVSSTTNMLELSSYALSTVNSLGDHEWVTATTSLRVPSVHTNRIVSTYGYAQDIISVQSPLYIEKGLTVVGNLSASDVFIQKPLRALASASDMTGLYYKPFTGTVLPNLWQELVTADGRPLSSVSEYTLDDAIFGLLTNTDQHPSTTPGFPKSSIINGTPSEICVSSIEFGFSTGANGLTVTWPSQVIWPDEPDRTPPTQFQPNMCYRFVARMEPIPDPGANMYSDATITYKWAILISQTYSYPNPWATA